MKSKSILPIAVDTREQLPFPFRGIKPRLFSSFSIRTATLDTGDYTTAELGDSRQSICIERKSLTDLYLSLGCGRARFEREAVRMAEYEYAAIVIEADWSAILNPNEHLKHETRMSAASVSATLLAWNLRYGIHIWPCPDRAHAEVLTFRLLERFHYDRSKEKENHRDQLVESMV